ncbi:MAG: hypothetical protein H0U56_07610 [Methylibium sp.]|nr:hypothetical protein [Methylibium sp.]
MSSSFDRPGGSSRPPASGSGWEATRVQTQIAPRLGAAVKEASEGHDIGRAVGGNTRELFVSCEPGEALAQQLDHLRPEYVAVHDLGTTASRKLLAGIAAASQRALQQLVIRRRGGGTTLATIEFVDCQAANGRSVRLYSTAVEADTATRQTLARVLLGRSRIGLVIVGDLPGHAIASALAPLREAVLRPGWACRRLLFMPLMAGAALPAEVARFRAATAIDATPTPQVTRPVEVWNALCDAWNPLQSARPAADGKPVTLLQPFASSAAAPGAAAAGAVAAASLGTIAGTSSNATHTPPWRSASAPMPMPMPVVGAVPATGTPLERYLHDLSLLAGVVSVCAFDIASARPIGHAGARPGPHELALHGAALLAAVMSASRTLGLGASVPECSVTLGQHHLLVRALPAHPGAALHVVLDKPQANVALVQMQLRRLDEALLRAATGKH